MVVIGLIFIENGGLRVELWPFRGVGGGSHPNFIQNSFFALFCRLSVRALGHPNCLNRSVPRTPFKILCFSRRTKSVFYLFCRLSVLRLGRPFLFIVFFVLLGVFLMPKNMFLKKVRFGASKRSSRLGRVSKLVIGLIFIENGGLRVELWPFPFLLF